MASHAAWRNLTNYLGPCSSLEDCPHGMQCYPAGTPWLAELPSAQHGANGTCYCYAFFGWSGPSCDELTATTVVLLCVCGGAAAGIAAPLLQASADGVRLAALREAASAQMAATALLAAAFLGGVVLNVALVLMALSGPYYNLPADERALAGDPYGDYNAALKAGSALQMAGSSCGLLTMSVVWVQVAVSAWHNRDMRGAELCRRYRAFALAVAATTVVLYVPLVVLDKWALVVVLLVPIQLGFILGVLVLRRRMNALLDSTLDKFNSSLEVGTEANPDVKAGLEARAAQMRRVRRALDRCCRRVAASLALQLLLSASWGIAVIVQLGSDDGKTMSTRRRQDDEHASAASGGLWLALAACCARPQRRIRGRPRHVAVCAPRKPQRHGHAHARRRAAARGQAGGAAASRRRREPARRKQARRLRAGQGLCRDRARVGHRRHARRRDRGAPLSVISLEQPDLRTALPPPDVLLHCCSAWRGTCESGCTWRRQEHGYARLWRVVQAGHGRAGAVARGAARTRLREAVARGAGNGHGCARLWRVAHATAVRDCAAGRTQGHGDGVLHSPGRRSSFCHASVHVEQFVRIEGYLELSRAVVPQTGYDQVSCL
jgi:hypothetical protein